jgi:hypothetical protein
MAEERDTDALLGKYQSHPTPSTASADLPSPQPSTTKIHDKPTPLRVIIVISSVLLISDLAGYAAFAPQLDIFESIICQQYYAGLGNSTTLIGHLDRQKCKIAPVQSELALINGWSDMFPQIPGR